LRGEVLNVGGQGAQFPGVVEERLVAGEFGVGEAAGDGLAVDLAGPFVVRAVQAGRVGRILAEAPPGRSWIAL
jgi:hypothetical protein